jgi:hypothetical protein
MTNFRQLPPAHRGATFRPGSAALVGVLERLGSPDPRRDAAVISLAVFGRLEQFLWEAPASDGDIDHVVVFCEAAVTRPA